MTVFPSTVAPAGECDPERDCLSPLFSPTSVSGTCWNIISSHIII